MENNGNSKSTGLKVALGILLVLFLGTGFYTSKLYNEKKETEATLVKEKQQVMTDLNNMAKQYDIVIGENETANQNLVEARARIQGLMDSLKVSQNSVASLWQYKKKYLSLQEEMNVLLTENDKLKIENSLLATSLDSTNVKLAERTMFTDSLLIQNTEISNVLENAAVLQTVGLKAFGVIERSSGKLIPTERASRSDKIRVCYTVAKNSLVGAGDKELYVQVTDSKGNILGANEQITVGSESVNYSLVSKFNYENRSLNICEFVSPSGDFAEGRYVVNVYNSKELVSTTEFTLK
ncbi:chromosome partitioning protein ParA [Subsaxibacter sp. CAU 1640]|uniref:chromosome partitioning protein ParA n=1 Tax=Subsaxibacter sp. CAU 1640 TaxID=2933271 RepID=UPI0020065A5F|nr:chromosome partitioning protein ParA [Subsaxibacter sp. CAU 1640]MCK7590521.1 chromosome partitioning protein ParA [Subsaxibacter sp. CAU 1640]